MANQIQPTGIRMPVELKQWLAKMAEKNRRSFNGEVVKRLEDLKEAEESAERVALQ